MTIIRPMNSIWSYCFASWVSSIIKTTSWWMRKTIMIIILRDRACTGHIRIGKLSEQISMTQKNCDTQYIAWMCNVLAVAQTRSPPRMVTPLPTRRDTISCASRFTSCRNAGEKKYPIYAENSIKNAWDWSWIYKCNGEDIYHCNHSNNYVLFFIGTLRIGCGHWKHHPKWMLLNKL